MLSRLLGLAVLLVCGWFAFAFAVLMLHRLPLYAWLVAGALWFLVWRSRRRQSSGVIAGQRQQEVTPDAH